jgi:deoxyribodipyrimidine photo-lyase
MGNVLFWHRRDLRTTDNAGLYQALLSNHNVVPVFIFDDQILDKLPANDRRVNLIYNELLKVRAVYQSKGADLIVRRGDPCALIPELAKANNCAAVYTNEDYEPYAVKRDLTVKQSLETYGISFESFKDQVIFAPGEVLKPDSKPYTVYTPFKKRWLARLSEEDYKSYDCEKHFDNLAQFTNNFPDKTSLGIEEAEVKMPAFELGNIENYEENRNFPAVNKCSFTSVYLRFGMLSPRFLVQRGVALNETYLSELIWREFFMTILHYFPHVVVSNFRAKYDGVEWRNNEEEFAKWCKGETGYPIVDAGMRELNETGLMHNRVRMIVASFLCKHLLIDWRWGEAYFAEKLLDFELSSNNGNWQWAAGTGCDASPYFRVFNPYTQTKKFDKDLLYVKKWVKDLNEFTYPQPIVEHAFARTRALETYKAGLS